MRLTVPFGSYPRLIHARAIARASPGFPPESLALRAACPGVQVGSVRSTMVAHVSSSSGSKVSTKSTSLAASASRAGRPCDRPTITLRDTSPVCIAASIASQFPLSAGSTRSRSFPAYRRNSAARSVGPLFSSAASHWTMPPALCTARANSRTTRSLPMPRSPTTATRTGAGPAARNAPVSWRNSASRPSTGLSAGS